MERKAKKPIGVSLVLCCYNSEKRLFETLKHIATQNVAKEIKWEVILVDNNSQDNTAKVAREHWNMLNLNIPMYIINQPIPGLSAAREKGFAHVTFEYVLFCDDDNWLNPNYVQDAFVRIGSDPSIGIVGGIGEAVFGEQEPGWFNFVKGQFATGPQANQSGDLSRTRRYVYGAGMVIRYSAYDYLRSKGFKSILTGRKGNELSSGEDNELCYAMIFAGYKVWYDDKLVFKHFLPKGRLTWEYLERLNKAFAVTAYYLRAYTYHFTESTSDKSMIWLRDLRYLIQFLPRITLDYLKQPKDSDRQKYHKILLDSHIYLIKTYLIKNNQLDKSISKIGKLINRFKV